MRHPYTEALLRSIPRTRAARATPRLQAIPGRPPDVVTPTGRVLASRPGAATRRPNCLEEPPPLEGPTPEHRWACFHPVGTPEGTEALDRNRRAGRTAAGLPIDSSGELLATAGGGA